MSNRIYKSKHELHNHGEFRGLDAYAEVWVEDQWGAVHQSSFIYRVDYKTSAAFNKAIEEKKRHYLQRKLAG